MSTTSKGNVKMMKPLALRRKKPPKSKDKPALWKPGKHAKGRKSSLAKAMDLHGWKLEDLVEEYERVFQSNMQEIQSLRGSLYEATKEIKRLQQQLNKEKD